MSRASWVPSAAVTKPSRAATYSKGSGAPPGLGRFNVSHSFARAAVSEPRSNRSGSLPAQAARRPCPTGPRAAACGIGPNASRTVHRLASGLLFRERRESRHRRPLPRPSAPMRAGSGSSARRETTMAGAPSRRPGRGRCRVRPAWGSPHEAAGRPCVHGASHIRTV